MANVAFWGHRKAALFGIGLALASCIDVPSAPSISAPTVARASSNPAVFTGQLSCGRVSGDVRLAVSPTKGAPFAPDVFIANGTIGPDTNLGIVRISGTEFGFQLLNETNTALTGAVVLQGAMTPDGAARVRIPSAPACRVFEMQPVPSPQMNQFLQAAFSSRAVPPSESAPSRFCRDVPLGPPRVSDTGGHRSAQATVGGQYLYYDRCAEIALIEGVPRPGIVFSSTPHDAATDEIVLSTSGQRLSRRDVRPVAWEEACIFATRFDYLGRETYCLPDGYRYRPEVLRCLEREVDGSLTGRMNAAFLALCAGRTTAAGALSPFQKT